MEARMEYERIARQGALLPCVLEAARGSWQLHCGAREREHRSHDDRGRRCAIRGRPRCDSSWGRSWCAPASSQPVRLSSSSRAPRRKRCNRRRSNTPRTWLLLLLRWTRPRKTAVCAICAKRSRSRLRAAGTSSTRGRSRPWRRCWPRRWRTASSRSTSRRSSGSAASRPPAMGWRSRPGPGR